MPPSPTERGHLIGPEEVGHLPDSLVPVGVEEGTTATVVADVASEEGATPENGVSRSYLWHVLGLLIVLIALIPIVDNGSFAIPDEGVYSAQAENLSNGSWAAERPASDIDTEGNWAVLSDSSFRGSEGIPYARRPLYPLALTTFWKVGGIVGGIVLSVFGTWAAAALSGLIASRFDRRAAAPTLWLAGIGSPLLFDAYLLVGHSIAAAFAAALSLAVVRALEGMSDRPAEDRRVPWRWITLAIVAVVPLTLLRTEGIIFVGGLGAALGLAAIRLSERRIDVRRLAFAFALVAFGAATYLLNNTWGRAITSGADGDVTFVDRHSNALDAVWYSVLRPWFPDNTTASAAMVLVVVGSVAGPITIRFAPRFRVLGVGFLVLAGGAAVIRGFESTDLVSGLVPAIPWIVIGLCMLGRSDLRTAGSRTLLTAACLAFVVVTFTSYGDGGAAEWGGRFYHLLLPALAPVAALGLLRLTQTLTRAELLIAFASIALLTTALSVASIRASTELRRITGEVETYLNEISASHDGLMVFAPLTPSGASRLLWRVGSPTRPMLTAPELRALPLLLDEVPSRHEAVTVVSTTRSAMLVDVVIRNAKNGPWTVTSFIDDGPLGVFELERS